MNEKNSSNPKSSNEEITKRLNDLYVNVLGEKNPALYENEDILFNYEIDNIEFKKIDFSINGINKHLSNISLKNRLIKHNKKNQYFFREQKRVINKIYNSNFRCILQATTSFGKTTIVKEILFNENFNRILFIVPTINLKNELTNDFNNIFLEKGYHIISRLDIEKEPTNDKAIIISTQENLLNLKWIDNYFFDIVILDEAYNINKGDRRNEGDYSRKLVLNKVIKKYFEKQNQKIILLSPSIGKFSYKTLEYLNSKEINIIHTPFMLVGKKIQKCETKEEMYKKIIDNLHKEKNIIYIQTPLGQREFIEGIFDDKNNNYINSLNSNEIIDYLQNFFPDKWYWIKAFKNRILINNGKMPNFLKKFTISLFCNNDDYHTLIGNSSLFYGINTPTKNIFVYDLLKKEGKKAVNIIDINNLIGRAGRYGKFNYGNILLNSNDMNEQDIKEYENKYEFDIDFIENKEEYDISIDENNSIENSILNEILLKTSFTRTKILNVIRKIEELINGNKKIDLFNLGEFGIFYRKNNKWSTNENLWSDFDSFYFCIHLYIKRWKYDYTMSLNYFYDNVIDDFIKNQIQNRKDVDKYKKLKNNENEKIDFLIDFLFSYFKYKFLTGLELVHNILSIMINKELNNIELIKESRQNITIILDFFKYSLYDVEKNIDNKQKYIEIYQDLLELGYHHIDIKKKIKDIYLNIEDNYSNYDLIKFMKDIKNPFIEKIKK